MKGKENYTINGELALLKTSFNICSSGGIISIINDGQIGPDSMHIGEGGRTTNVVSGEEYDFGNKLVYNSNGIRSDVVAMKRKQNGGTSNHSSFNMSVTLATIESSRSGYVYARKDYSKELDGSTYVINIGELDKVRISATFKMDNPPTGVITVKGESPGSLGNSEDTNFTSQSTSITLGVPFNAVGIKSGGINKYTTTINWKYIGGTLTDWKSAGSSTITIYTILASPNAPWNNSSNGGNQKPWTAALDMVVNWSKGATSIDGAIKRIAHAIFFDCKFYYNFNKSSIYAMNDKFYLRAFISEVTAGKSKGIICYDTAASVVTFANLIGADLVEGHMVGSGTGISGDFRFNNCRFIGEDNKRYNPDLAIHAVAFEGNSGDNPKVTDACLILSGEQTPPVLYDYSSYKSKAARNSVKISVRSKKRTLE